MPGGKPPGSPAPVEARMFGPVEAGAGPHRLGPGDFGGIKAKQVFELLLAARGHGVPKDRLVDRLWGEDPPRHPLAALENHVSTLRRHLSPQRWGRGLVLTGPGSYRLASERIDLDLDAHAASIERTEQALAAAGLPPLSWYDALWSLYRAPGRKLRMGELSQQVVTISRSGLTRLVDRFEAAGLVRREASPEDRRGTVVAITREGSSLLRRMWPVYAAEIRRSFVDTLEERDAFALIDILARIHAAALWR